MLLIFFVWFADISDLLSVGIRWVGAGAIFASILLTIFLYETKKKLWPTILMSCLGVFMILFGLLLPSKQGVYQIMAAYGAVETVQYLQQSDDAKRIAGKSIQAIEKMLDDAIKEDKK